MPDKEIAEVLKHHVPIPAGEIPRLFEMLRECKKESEITQRETKKYEAMKEVMLAEIAGKYAFYEMLFSKIFAERAEAIQKDFQVIDQGIKRNDRALIAAGVSGLSQIVSCSPAVDMEKLKRLLG
ncbi:MAG: hypothetical protein FWC65_03765 [Treponema sp.]|nr:hypothetical protein [Treponema sp.]